MEDARATSQAILPDNRQSKVTVMARVVWTRRFRFGLAIFTASATLFAGCAHHAGTVDATAPAATAIAAAPIGSNAPSGPTVVRAAQLRLLTPRQIHPAAARARAITREEIQRELDRAKHLLARTNGADHRWSDDRAPLIHIDELASLARSGNDLVAKDVTTNLAQGEDFFFDAEIAANCSRRGSTVRYLREDAAEYLRAARSYIDMAASDFAYNRQNPDDWSPPVPETHEEEGEGC